MHPRKTDKLQIGQIKNIINQSILGEEYQAFEYQELNKGSDHLQINHSQSSIWIEQKSHLFKDPEKSLMERSKRAHLTYEQKLLIYKCYQYEKSTLSQIWQKFGVSFSTTRRIIKQFSLNIRRQEVFSKIRWRKNIDSHIMTEWISDFVRKQTGWFDSIDVQRYIKSKLLIFIPLHQIRKNLKRKEHLSFKKGSSRPVTLNTERLKLLKSLFWVKLSQKLPEIKMLINVDESSFGKDTTKNYSWLKTGKDCSIKNIKFKSSVNVISSMTTSGLSFNMFKYAATTANDLWIFLKFVFDYIKENEGLNPEQIGIILDNCSVHRSYKVKGFWRKIGVNLYYLPAYWPELAPIELYFSRLKKTLISQAGIELINLKSDVFIDIISHWVQTISREDIKKIWSNLYGRIKEEISMAGFHT